MSLVGRKMKVILEQEDGSFFELDAISAELRQSVDFTDVSHEAIRDYLPTETRVEMSFVGVGDVTHGKKRIMVVCIGCGSEWNDDPYHPGTCCNCGWGAGSTKRERKG